MSAVDFIVYFKKSERKLNPTVNGLIGHASGKYFIIRKGVVHYCVTTPFFRRRDKIRTCDLCVPNAALYQTEPRAVIISNIHCGIRNKKMIP